MKLALNKKGKIVVVPNKGQQVKIQKKSSAYERYVAHAKQQKVDYILTKEDYKTTVVANKLKHRYVTPAVVARWQAQGGKTDKQIRAMLNAAKQNDPTLTRKQFIAQKGWEEIQSQASAMYVNLKELYPNLTTTELGKIIGQQLYGSP